SSKKLTLVPTLGLRGRVVILNRHNLQKQYLPGTSTTLDDVGATKLAATDEHGSLLHWEGITMSYRLHKRGVLTGSLNCYCLACDTFLMTRQEADKHVETSLHQRILLAIPYSDKFKDEHIRKFQTGYYCEFCNTLLPTASKVNLHVTEDEHVKNKGLNLLLPKGGGVVAFGNIFIEENAWHSLIDGVCSICEEEFEEGEDHKATARHSLNLVLKNIQFATGDAIYRQVSTKNKPLYNVQCTPNFQKIFCKSNVTFKDSLCYYLKNRKKPSITWPDPRIEPEIPCRPVIDDTSLQCVTCNKLLVPDKVTAHFDDAQHRELYNKCRIVSNGVDHGSENKVIKEEVEGSPFIEFKGELKKSNINENQSTESKTTILESMSKYQSAGININLERETAYCKKCSEVVEFDCTNIEKHITNHSTNAPVDSTLQYPSNPDQNLNRVDINDKTAQPSDKDDEIEEKIKALQYNSILNNEKVESADEGDNSDEELENEKEFAKGNKITFNKNNKQSYCRLCEVHLPATLKSMKEHVAGANHKRLSASTPTIECRIKKSAKLIKTKSEDFIEDGCVYMVHSPFETHVIINEEYCITKNSYTFLTKSDSRLRCILCQVTLPPYCDTDEHVQSRNHVTKFLNVPVIMSTENEFIREVHPGLYHCGYCELVMSGWPDMEKHLKCSDHQDNRRKGERRLIESLPVTPVIIRRGTRLVSSNAKPVDKNRSINRLRDVAAPRLRTLLMMKSSSGRFISDGTYVAYHRSRNARTEKRLTVHTQPMIRLKTSKRDIVRCSDWLVYLRRPIRTPHALSFRLLST
ncbi:hypothetical protein SFRURICE_019168, partial [Spodoptera frugiperda]